MNKLKLLIVFSFTFFLFPFTSSAQLEKINPGMTLEEVKKNFPDLQPDFSSMSSLIESVDTFEGLKGVTEYVIRQDTLLRYDFTSNNVSGPCQDYPGADSIKYHQLISVARNLLKQYTLLYGNPAEHSSMSPLTDDTSQFPVPVLYAKWIQGDNELRIAVNRPGKHTRQLPNGPPPSVEDLKPGCKYLLEILSIGTGKAFRKSCGNGITGLEFKNLHPSLAVQVENHPDSWAVVDTNTSRYGNWEFTFEGGKLDSYDLMINDGAAYSHSTDTAYLLLRARTLMIEKEAEKKYGKPFKLVNKMFDKFPGRGSRLYHTTTYFGEEWKMDDKKLYIIFNETSNFKEFEPIFRLQVYFGRPLME
jgi:hypothetical protein